MTRSSTLACIVATAALCIGCDARQPLVVKDPDVATPGSANGPSAIPFLRIGTLADFAIAFAGAADQANNAHEGISNLGGLFTDELTAYDTFNNRTALNTRLAVSGNLSLSGVFGNLGLAHNDARRVLGLYAKFAPGTSGQAEMYSIDAYIYILVAEHFCSGQPFSLLDIATGTVTNSAFLSTTQMLDTAVAEFALATTAATAAGDATQLNLAALGTARAQLDLGNVTQAAAAATAVTPGFIYQIFESSNSLRQFNGIFFFNTGFQAFSVAQLKNGNGLAFALGGDPRISGTLAANPVGSNGLGPFYLNSKYPAASAAVTLADSTEAQLIIAEADIMGGGYAAGKAIEDRLRSHVGLGALPNVGGGGTQAEILQLLDERGFWMWVTGHRIGDWRRVVRNYGFPIGSVFPTGTHEFGSMQNIFSFPTSLTTNANPNYASGACDGSQP
ncbi:MAG TPA: hypothetical protein VNW46_07655 [Gemmatimonadaceae bacterium]|jgi:hypothetical protein|nr:hypothetical protein [Gemmatimonadaceae bacterium]